MNGAPADIIFAVNDFLSVEALDFFSLVVFFHAPLEVVVLFAEENVVLIDVFALHLGNVITFVYVRR